MDAVHMGVAPVTGDAEDLCWFWNDRDAELGVVSSHGVAVNRAQGLSGGAAESCRTFEEGACWAHRVAWRGWHVGKALRKLSPQHVQVLYAAFGPRNPAARTDLLEDQVARVAPYTALVERMRVAMAEERAVVRTAAVRAEEEARVARRDTVVAAAEARIARGEVAGGRRAIAAATRPALDEEAMGRIARSQRRAALLELGPSDVLRVMLGPRLEREGGESDAAFRSRKARIRECVAPGVEQLSRAAKALLREAMAAYAAARGEVP